MIKARRSDIVELLIIHGADFKAYGYGGTETFSYLAIEAGMIETVALMTRMASTARNSCRARDTQWCTRLLNLVT